MRRIIKKLGSSLLTLVLLFCCGCSAMDGVESSEAAGNGTVLEDFPGYDVLTFPLIVSGSAPKNLPGVQYRINEYIADKIGAVVQFTLVDVDIVEQYYLIHGTGDTAPDFVNLLPAEPELSVLIDAGVLMPLDGLLAEYGQGVAEAAAEIIATGQLNGVQYMIPGLSETCAMGTSVEISAALVKKYGFDLTSIQTITDLEPMLEVIARNESDVVPITAYTATGFTRLLSGYDNLTDTLGVLNLKAGDTTQVVNWFETEEFITLAQMIRTWYEKGYIDPDVLVEQESAIAQIQQGKAFCTVSTIMPMGDQGMDLNNSSGVVEIQLADLPQLRTSYDAGLMGVGISSQCEHPEKAMQLLELLYTDEYLVNLLQYGLEGEDYTVTQDGLVDTGGSRFLLYGQPMNMTLRTITVEEGADYRRNCAAFRENDVISPAFGFVFDSAPVFKEAALCTAVVEKYFPLIDCGCVDPEAEIPKFLSELRDAGIDKVIAEKQRQLDTWLAGAF